MGRCQPIRVECPAGQVDVSGDGHLCEPLDPIEAPQGCLTWPGGPALPASGEVECAFPWRAGGEPLRVSASVGCLDVNRRPFPRAMVNIPVEFAVSRIIPPQQLYGIPFGQPGSYRLSAAEPWATEGLFLHERYGSATTDSYGQQAFDTRTLLAGDAYPYPTVNNVRARLVFRLATSPAELTWTTAGFSEVLHGGLGAPVRTTYARSSFPLAGYADLFTPYGPARDGRNALPAFKLRLRSRWSLYLLAEWDTFTVNDAHEYVLSGHEWLEAAVGPAYTSQRVWDGRQAPTNTGGSYCNAADGFIPVPVIEAQTVLR